MGRDLLEPTPPSKPGCQEGGGESPIPPPLTAAKGRRGPGGYGIGGSGRRKIGRIGVSTVGRGSDGKEKMFIRTVYKRVFMVEFAKNR